MTTTDRSIPKFFVGEKYTQAPTFQSMKDRVFTIYFFDEKIGTVELIGTKWTSFNLEGKKVSARKGAWWNSTELLVEKALHNYIEANGWDAYAARCKEFRPRM